jgi:TolA-binding protein
MVTWAKVFKRFPSSAEAPEATFHLGVSYDHPNLSAIAVAARFYRLTVERYPGTEAAGKSQEALAKIDQKAREVLDGRHGAR